jgi:plastocyanin
MRTLANPTPTLPTFLKPTPNKGHNFALYESKAAETEIFVGEIINGPDETITYEFEAPSEPGTYFFRCDVHPLTMTGRFIVE